MIFRVVCKLLNPTLSTYRIQYVGVIRAVLVMSDDRSWQSWSTITSVVMETCVLLCSSKGLLDLCPVRHELLWNRVLRTTLGDFQIHLFHWSLNRFILEVIFLSPSSWFFAHFPGIKYFIAFPSFFFPFLYNSFCFLIPSKLLTLEYIAHITYLTAYWTASDCKRHCIKGAVLLRHIQEQESSEF